MTTKSKIYLLLQAVLSGLAYYLSDSVLRCIMSPTVGQTQILTLSSIGVKGLVGLFVVTWILLNESVYYQRRLYLVPILGTVLAVARLWYMFSLCER